MNSTQPVNYLNHDVDCAFEVLKNKQNYSVRGLGGAIIQFDQDVFITDKLNFEFIKFCSEFIKNHPGIKNVADLGTGSGVIGVTLAKLYENKNFAGFDISPKALELARHNAQMNKISNIEFIKSQPKQWIPQEYSKPIDLIISNPPFIGREEWNNSKFLEDFPDCKYQPLEAIKTDDEYGNSEYIAITKAAIERNVKFVIFRLNKGYANKLLASLKNYQVSAELIALPGSCPVLIVKSIH